MVPCKITAEEVSVEWSHYKTLLTDSKVTTSLDVSLINSWNERIKKSMSYNAAMNLHVQFNLRSVDLCISSVLIDEYLFICLMMESL